MRRTVPALVLTAALAAPTTGPAAAQEARECEGPNMAFTLVFEDGACTIDGTEGRVREREDRRECRISTPQLRIITLREDGAFSWEDTDDDRVTEGTCAPA